MTALSISLWISVVVWSAVLLYTREGSFRILAGRGIDHDATKWGIFLVAIVMLGFNGRWLFAPDNLTFLIILRYLGAVLALYLMAIVRFYKQ